MFTFRFDMRAPDFGAPKADLYTAAIEMVEFAETRGAAAVVLCEHHQSADGYLPAPLVLATAMAARSIRIPLKVAIFQLPLYDPIRLAEEMCVIDIISRGRVSYVGGLGYLPQEYEQFGVDFRQRGKLAEEYLPVLLKAVTGEAFEYQGRNIKVTPAPFTPGGPNIGWGGGSIAAAQRAGRYGVDFMAQSDGDELREAYENACRDSGHPPGDCFLPPRDMATTVFVAEDVDRAWEELGPYLMHDVLSYAEWNVGRDAASLSFTKTADELRAENTTHRILSVDEAVAYVQGGTPLALHPLIGGLPPEIAWHYLRVVTDQVMPALQAKVAPGITPG